MTPMSLEWDSELGCTASGRLRTQGAYRKPSSPVPCDRHSARPRHWLSTTPKELWKLAQARQGVTALLSAKVHTPNPEPALERCD